MLHSSAIHQSRKSVGGSPSRARGNVRMHCGGLSKTIKWLVSQRGNKYNISEGMINMYTWHLNLTIRHIMKSDFGAYSCSSVNALGKSEARIRLQELRLPPKPTTTPTPYVHTTATPRRKPPLNMNKDLNEVVRAKGTHFNSNTLKENEISNGIISSSNSGNSNSNSGRSSSSASGSNVYSSNRESSTNGVGVGVSGPNNINAANGLINGAEVSGCRMTQWVSAATSVKFLRGGYDSAIAMTILRHSYIECSVVKGITLTDWVRSSADR
uniref:Ig-like domain-containing protein n=1 Tax=Glossina morsitans morsitans TaxID=37546 RepID=A0A1B0G2V5_GLOMM